MQDTQRAREERAGGINTAAETREPAAETRQTGAFDPMTMCQPYRDSAVLALQEAIAQLQMPEWGDISLESARESIQSAVMSIRLAWEVMK